VERAGKPQVVIVLYQAHSEISSEDCSAVAAGAKCPGYRAITPSTGFLSPIDRAEAP
jgi:hypothetical protein